jgi:hypothetical protein
MTTRKDSSTSGFSGNNNNDNNNGATSRRHPSTPRIHSTTFNSSVSNVRTFSSASLAPLQQQQQQQHKPVGYHLPRNSLQHEHHQQQFQLPKKISPLLPEKILSSQNNNNNTNFHHNINPISDHLASKTARAVAAARAAAAVTFKPVSHEARVRAAQSNSHLPLLKPSPSSFHSRATMALSGSSQMRCRQFSKTTKKHNRNSEQRNSLRSSKESGNTQQPVCRIGNSRRCSSSSRRNKI